MTSSVRTRFAPSPTGFIHLGNLRSALYPWAFARAHGGAFVLRVEDTDIKRSTQASIDVILEGMQWLGLDYDEGPVFQTDRMPRYHDVLQQLIASGHAYPCYMSQTELDHLRAQQIAAKEKPRYNGTWRPEDGKVLPLVPQNVNPVWRFKTPQNGTVEWVDQCKGRVVFQNSELDDLVIARSDGTPTYNFCVCVDDIDMRISHVIRGDDHVNNTPRQIHLYHALGAPIPVFAHLPTVLDENGDKMSKRHGAKAVTEYRDEGIFPDAMLNYLARLGWSHGNDDVFSRAQFLQWFDLNHLGKNAARYDDAKLRWLNAQHMKAMPDDVLATHVLPFLQQSDVAHDPRIVAMCHVFKDRCTTLVELADRVTQLCNPVFPANDAAVTSAIQSVQPALLDLHARLATIDWAKDTIAQAIKDTLATHGLKMPQLAMPVRMLMMGTPHTPALDAVLEVLGQSDTLARLAHGLNIHPETTPTMAP